MMGVRMDCICGRQRLKAVVLISLKLWNVANQQNLYIILKKYFRKEVTIQLSDEIILKCKNSNNPKGFTILDENYIVIRDDVEEYLNTFSEYMEVLEMLSHAPEEQYLKFFDDIEKMKKEGLRPDYCHYGNLFYDKDVGFSFIDVYPVQNMAHDSLPVNQIFNIIVNPRFRMRTKSGSLSVLPKELKRNYNMYMSDICKKIFTGLNQYGYPQDEIKRFIDSKCYYFDETACLSQEELQHKIEEMNNVKDFSLYIEL